MINNIYIYIHIVDTVVYTSSNQFTDAVHSPVYHDGFTQDISVQVFDDKTQFIFKDIDKNSNVLFSMSTPWVFYNRGT